MSKGKVGLFGRVIASSLIALNFMGGVGFCSPAQSAEISARDKYVDINRVLSDRIQFCNICDNVLYEFFYSLDDSIEYPIDLVQNIRDKSKRTKRFMSWLMRRMYKPPDEKGRKRKNCKGKGTSSHTRSLNKKYILSKTNSWDMEDNFRFTSSICRDSINLLKILYNKFDSYFFRVTIENCRTIIIKNMKRMRAIKTMSVVVDPRFFHKIDREFKLLMARLERFEDIKNEINMDNSIN